MFFYHFPLFFGVVFALMSFLLAMLQSCSVAVSNQIPSDVCVRGNGPTCLCVMYISVALYGIYNEPEEWDIRKTRAWFLQSSQSWHVPESKEKFWPRSSWETKPSDLWDQPVLLLLQSVWRIFKLMWSLWCPLLLGVGSAWCRWTGDVLIKAQQYCLLALLLKVLLVWMTIFLTLERVGCRVENEYTISVGSNLTNLIFFVYFFKEMKCRVWCILHMFFWKVNLRTFCTRLSLLSTAFLRCWFETKHLKWL